MIRIGDVVCRKWDGLTGMVGKSLSNEFRRIGYD